MKWGVLLALAVMVTPAHAVEPIEGEWRLPKGQTVAISVCEDAYCLVMSSGRRAGQLIGRVTGSGDRYAGEFIDPESGKAQPATLEITGEGLKLSACAGIICGSRLWTRL